MSVCMYVCMYICPFCYVYVGRVRIHAVVVSPCVHILSFLRTYIVCCTCSSVLVTDDLPIDTFPSTSHYYTTTTVEHAVDLANTASSKYYRRAHETLMQTHGNLRRNTK